VMLQDCVAYDVVACGIVWSEVYEPVIL
jgi:hypothetical protein